MPEQPTYYKVILTIHGLTEKGARLVAKGIAEEYIDPRQHEDDPEHPDTVRIMAMDDSHEIFWEI